MIKIREIKKETLREKLARQQVLAPCVWDCMSTNIAACAGFDATLLSGGTYAESNRGLPDIGMITQDDIVRGAAAISQYCALPCVVDADDGYGETPLNTYRTAKRLVAAGAAGFTIDDSTGIRGFPRGFEALRNNADHKGGGGVVSRKVWLAKIKAALDACAGTDTIVFARTEAKMAYGIDEAIERALLARELGAEMSCVIGITTMEDAVYVGERVPGWKMWPDVMSRNGVPDVDLDEIYKLGFNFVTMHILEKGAYNGMLDTAIRTLRDRNTLYHDGMVFNYTTPEETDYLFWERNHDHWLQEETAYYKAAKAVLPAEEE